MHKEHARRHFLQKMSVIGLEVLISLLLFFASCVYTLQFHLVGYQKNPIDFQRNRYVVIKERMILCKHFFIQKQSQKYFLKVVSKSTDLLTFSAP